MILLPRERYFVLTEKIKEVQINNLFARSVIEQHVSGEIYVDNVDNPETIYVIHPYGMSLLFGNYSNQDFNSRFKLYVVDKHSGETRYEWMQTFPREWDNVIQNLFQIEQIKPSSNPNHSANELIEIHSRVNFKFNENKYSEYKRKAVSESGFITETTSLHFEQMKGSVIPARFWDSAKDFTEKGKGFSLIVNGEVASTAYSAFVHENKLEIGIETLEKYRGQGYAEQTCSRLIDFCMENNRIPVWSCRFENTASYRLALKLGFEPTLKIPFYRLSR